MSQLRRSMSRSKIEVASRLCQKIGGDTDGDNRQPPKITMRPRNLAF